MAEGNLLKQTKKGLYWKFAEQLSNYGIQFIIGIAMARMLSPKDYGISAIPAVFLAISGIFISGGFGSALVRKPELKEEDLSTAYIYSMSVGCICYILLFIASPWIADFYETPVLKSLIRVTALSFIYSPIGTPQGVLLKRRLDFKTPAKISVFIKLLSGVIGVTMAYTGYGVWALIISGLVAGIAGQIITISVVRWYPKTGWSKESFRYLWDYGNKIMASSLINTVYSNITPVIVGKFFSMADLGVYNRARGYANLPSSHLHGVVNSVSFPVLSKIQNDDEKLIYNYRRMIKVSGFVTFPIMMLLSALSRPLIITMITAKWESCIILLQIICFSMMWYPIHALNLNILQIKGRSDLFLKLEIIKKIWGVILLCVSLPFGLVAFCSAQVFDALVSLYINTWYTGKLYGFGFKKQIKDLTPILLLGLLMFTAVVGITHIIPYMLLQIIIGSIAGAIIYLGGAYLLKLDVLKDFKYLISRR